MTVQAKGVMRRDPNRGLGHEKGRLMGVIEVTAAGDAGSACPRGTANPGTLV